MNCARKMACAAIAAAAAFFSAGASCEDLLTLAVGAPNKLGVKRLRFDASHGIAAK
jgi:hypothetical protein